MKMPMLTCKLLIPTIAFLCLVIVSDTEANEIKLIDQLNLTPARCIALHQGQVCYQKIQIRWQAKNNSDYCLYQKDHEQAIYCWQSLDQGLLTYEFASNSTQTLQLVDIKEKKLISQAQIEVAWVYKANTRRKTHWRLF